MGVVSSLQTAEVDDDLKTDPRWQLIERILATGPFQKSGRLRELLPYMAERAIHGHSHETTGHNTCNWVDASSICCSWLPALRIGRAAYHRARPGSGRRSTCLDSPFYVGLGFCSHLPIKADTAVFSNVVLKNSAGKVQ